MSAQPTPWGQSNRRTRSWHTRCWSSIRSGGGRGCVRFRERGCRSCSPNTRSPTCSGPAASPSHPTSSRSTTSAAPRTRCGPPTLRCLGAATPSSPLRAALQARADSTNRSRTASKCSGPSERSQPGRRSS
eukprot:7257076-Prymnesium_polylepis.1